MKRMVITLLTLFFLSLATGAFSQCSICTKTAQQLGEKPATALNTGILYLAAAPLAILAIIGIRWWKANKDLY